VLSGEGNAGRADAGDLDKHISRFCFLLIGISRGRKDVEAMRQCTGTATGGESVVIAAGVVI
jgi:hypothetical protein